MTHGLLVLQRLAVRRNQALAAMSVLSDSPGADWVVTQKHKPKAGTKAPSKQGTDSLYWHWRQRFDEDWPAVPDDPDEAALDWCTDRATTLIIEAETALRARTGESAVVVTEDGYARTKRLVADHVGESIFDMARAEHIPEGQARQARREMRVCIPCGRKDCKHHGKR